MFYQDTVNSYIKPVTKDTSANFSQELLIFLSHHPDFLRNRSHLDFLRYCFFSYINCDPTSSDLPIREQLKQAGQMSRKFMGIT